MPKIRTLIVDDELLARERLRQLLAAEPEIELVGECGDGREALEFVERESPDLLFLDVQMPELDGFSVVEGIVGTPPVVVFVTAHDQFALRAFEVHAVDYLLKPFDRERFQKALQRAIERVRHRDAGALRHQHQALLAEVKPAPARPLDRLAVKTSGRILFVRLAEIDWISAAHNYVELHVGKDSHLLRETVNAIEARLPADKFVRISRSAIVNIERIKELQPLFHGEFSVVLHSGTRVTLSRRFRDKLPQLGVG
jgi:two-component system, LytTR family, response regulator